MFKLTKIFRFEAAHQLPLHKGKCQRLHGHSWIVELECVGENLQREGSSTDMLMDFGDLSAAMKPLLEDKLDHYYLNTTLNMENPTSEKVAEYIFISLIASIPLLSAVTIHETCTSACRYEPKSK
jgi:6-pyruvoyltetrahydropterin/6-carboxytetrahydropterin synthase